MNWDKEILAKVNFENISHLEEKKKIVQKIVDKVEDGQVIRIRFRLNILFSNHSDSRKDKK